MYEHPVMVIKSPGNLTSNLVPCLQIVIGSVESSQLNWRGLKINTVRVAGVMVSNCRCYCKSKHTQMQSISFV